MLFSPTRRVNVLIASSATCLCRALGIPSFAQASFEQAVRLTCSLDGAVGFPPARPRRRHPKLGPVPPPALMTAKEGERRLPGPVGPIRHRLLRYTL